MRKKPRGVEALLLDLDGTLVNSNDFHTQAWVEAFEHFGKHFSFEEIRGHIGKGGDLLVPDHLTAREMKAFGKELQEYRKKLFRETYLPKVKPFPFVREHLEELHEMGILLVLASSSDGLEVEHYVDLMQIRSMVKGWTTKEDVRFSKPSPEIFQSAREIVRAHAERAMAVGDTPYDILAAHRSAIPIIALRSGGFPDQTLQKAEFLFDDTAELIRRIEAIHDYFAH